MNRGTLICRKYKQHCNNQYASYFVFVGSLRMTALANAKK